MSHTIELLFYCLATIMIDMTHYYEINDREGQLVDLVPFCSDWCHEQWCRDNGRSYEGWNGAHEHPYNDECVNCEAVIVGVESFVDA
jgi:hypothetical protein